MQDEQQSQEPNTQQDEPAPVNMPGEEKAAQQQPEESSMKGPKKTIAVIVAVILGVGLLGGGAYAYYFYYQTAPEQIIPQMVDNMTNVETAEYSGNLTAEIDTSNLSTGLSLGAGQGQQDSSAPQMSEISVDFSGASDIRDWENTKSSLEVDVTSDLSSSVSLQGRGIGDVTYLRFTRVPNIGLFDLSFLQDQWVEIDPEGIRQQLGLDNEELEEELQEQQELTAEQTEQIKNLARNTQWFEITERLSSEEVDGVDTHHYRYRVLRDGVKTIVTEFAKIAEDPLSEEELTEVEEALNEAPMPEGEIWISKDDLLLKKLLMSMVIEETEEVQTSGNVSVSVTFSNYNEPVDITAPESSKTIQEVMEEAFGGLFSGSSLGTSGSGFGASGDGLSAGSDFSDDAFDFGQSGSMPDDFGQDLNGFELPDSLEN